MTTSQRSAGSMRQRFFEDLDALEAIEHSVCMAESARDRAQAALDIAQAEYQQAAADVEDLDERRNALRANTVRVRKSFRTMAHFPVELLAIIFAAAVADRGAPDRQRRPEIVWDAALVPYRVAGVSRHWRHAALSSAKCWTYVVLPPVRRITPTKQASMPQYLELVLQRSRLLLLDVVVSIDWDRTQSNAVNSYAEHSLYARLFALLMAQSRRIISLVIETGLISDRFTLSTRENSRSATLLGEIISLLKCPTPELVNLSVFCLHTTGMNASKYWLGFPGDNDFPILLPHAPKLETLVVSNAPVLCRRPHPVGLPSLRTFNLQSHPTVYDALLWDTLAMASRLEELSLDGGIGATSTRHPVQLPDSIPIVRLEMDGDTWMEADVAMPRLCQLNIPAWKLSELTISESMAMTITTVDLDMVTITYELDTLRNLRAVEHASFEADSSIVDYGPFFDLLCEPVDPMWPRLRQLQLWSFDSQSIERDGLLRLVKARNGARDPDNDSHSPRALEKVKFDMKSVPGWVTTQVKEIMGVNCVVSPSE